MASLCKASDKRILRSPNQAAWLEEVACQCPKSRRKAEPNFPRVVVERVFNHKEMVRATMKKYNELPEIQNMTNS